MVGVAKKKKANLFAIFFRRPKRVHIILVLQILISPRDPCRSLLRNNRTLSRSCNNSINIRRAVTKRALAAMILFALRAAEALFMATTVMLLSYQPTTTLFAAAAACADSHNRSCFDCLMAGCDGTTNDDGDFECIKLAQPFAWNPADARQVCQPHDCQLITSSCEECLDNKCSWQDSGSCAANPGENGDECDGALPSFGPHWVVDADKNVTEIGARLEKQQQDNDACAGATTCQDCQSTMAAPDVACKWFENSYCRPSGNVDLGCMETDCDGESLAPCIGLGCQACVIAGCTWRNGPGTCRENCSFLTES